MVGCVLVTSVRPVRNRPKRQCDETPHRAHRTISRQWQWKPIGIAAASRGFLAAAWLSCYILSHQYKISLICNVATTKVHYTNYVSNLNLHFCTRFLFSPLFLVMILWQILTIWTSANQISVSLMFTKNVNSAHFLLVDEYINKATYVYIVDHLTRF